MSLTTMETVFNYDKLTTEELTDIALNKDGVIGVLEADSQFTKGLIPPRKDGYGAMWSPAKSGAVQILLLTGITPEKRQVIRQGKINVFTKYGLTEKEAELVLDERIPNVRAILPVLQSVLGNGTAIGHMLSHPCCTGRERETWYHKTSFSLTKLVPEFKKLSTGQEISLAKTVHVLRNKESDLKKAG